MRSRQDYIVTKDEVHGYAYHWLAKSLKLEYEGKRCTASTLFEILLIAAARMASVFAVCRDLADAPCDQTIRNALEASLPEISELERRLNLSLATELPRALLHKPRRIAIDLTLIPYHGQPWEDEKEIYRSLPKRGTTHFHAYATVTVVVRWHRLGAEKRLGLAALQDSQRKVEQRATTISGTAPLSRNAALDQSSRRKASRSRSETRNPT